MSESRWTSADFQKFVLQLACPNPDPNPPLHTFLESFWTQLRGRQEDELSFELIGQLFEEALSKPPNLGIDWEHEIVQPPQIPTQSTPNTPEYFAETRTFAYVEQVLKYQIIDLRRFQAGLPRYDQHWMNLDICTYLERATCNYEEIDDDADEKLDWADVWLLLNAGKYTE